MKRVVLGVSMLVSSGAAERFARADDLMYACKESSANAKLSVTFSPDTSLRDLVTWVVGFTCKTIVVDSEVHARQPRVSIVAPKQLSPKQALQLFVDAVEATGMSVITKRDTIIIKLGPKMPPKSCAADATVTTTATGTRIEADAAIVDSTATVELEQALTAGIRKVDATHYEIKRSVLDAVMQNPMAAAKGARVVPAVPAMPNGKAIGFKLYAIRPASLYAQIGLQNGDTVHALNGTELTSPDKALDVYTSLRDAKQVTIDLIRAGKALTIVITIV